MKWCSHTDPDSPWPSPSRIGVKIKCSKIYGVLQYCFLNGVVFLIDIDNGFFDGIDCLIKCCDQFSQNWHFFFSRSLSTVFKIDVVQHSLCVWTFHLLLFDKFCRTIQYCPHWKDFHIGLWQLTAGMEQLLACEAVDNIFTNPLSHFPHSLRSGGPKFKFHCTHPRTNWDLNNAFFQSLTAKHGMGLGLF